MASGVALEYKQMVPRGGIEPFILVREADVTVLLESYET
jgi:hypothetical protein